MPVADDSLRSPKIVVIDRSTAQQPPATQTQPVKPWNVNRLGATCKVALGTRRFHCDASAAAFLVLLAIAFLGGWPAYIHYTRVMAPQRQLT